MSTVPEAQEVSLGFRTHRYRFIVWDKIPPDAVMEHKMRNVARRIKLSRRDWPERRISMQVRDAIINNRGSI
jgi:hypothetical protein